MLRVLLADDEQYEREYLEKVIKESYPSLLEVVYKAVDGMDVMDKLEAYNPNIVLLDIKMPRMNGLTAAEEIRKKYPDIQLVIISAYSDFSYAKQAIKLGVTDYLLKPYLDSELRETLDKVITRAREREDSLAFLSYSSDSDDGETFDFYRDLEKDLIWRMFFRSTQAEDFRKEFALWGVGDEWLKVVLISSPALISMGRFSQEVLKNYFHMEGVTVLNSIWMDQMAICLFSPEPDAFTELTGCITRARNYLAEDSKMPVDCGVSGAYSGLDKLAEAYEEAAVFIRDYSGEDIGNAFADMSAGMKRICKREDRIIDSLADQNQEQSNENLTELIDELESCLMYQDVAVKLNFGRSLMTVIRGINRIPGVRIKTSEAVKRFEKLRELNFNGDNLKYHTEYFSEMEIQKE